MQAEYAIVLVTTSEDEESHLIARVLLEQKKAACINIIPKIKSMYWWNSTINESKESLLIIKTSIALVEDVIRLVKEIHSYDVPEIIALPIVSGNHEYLEWVAKETAAQEPE